MQGYENDRTAGNKMLDGVKSSSRVKIMYRNQHSKQERPGKGVPKWFGYVERRGKERMNKNIYVNPTLKVKD